MRGAVIFTSFCVVVLCSSGSADPVNHDGMGRNLDIHNVTDEQEWKNGRQRRFLFKPVRPEFRLYTRENRNESNIIKTDDKNSVDKSNFNPDHSTVVVVHGFTESAEAQWMKDIKDKRLDMEPCNVILVDWKELASWINPLDYFSASSNTDHVGKDIADLLNFLKRYEGFSTARTHIVGFSLGAHVAGHAGDELKQLGDNTTLGRITGLDPAGPLFEDGFVSSLCMAELKRRLDPSDADFVDVIRTNDDKYGCTLKLGHVDFLMNGGSSQPGCSGGFSYIDCSHGRAHDYYVESLNLTSGPSYGFLYENFETDKSSSCLARTLNYVGYSVTRYPEGTFYAKTKDESPFLASNSDLITLIPDKEVPGDIGGVKVKVSTDSDWEEMWRCGSKEKKYTTAVIKQRGEDVITTTEICFEKNWEGYQAQVEITSHLKDWTDVTVSRSPSKCSNPIPWWVWLLISVGIVIVIVMIIGIVCYFKNKSHYKTIQ